jgi:methionyl-tRNA formyltransferase
MSDVVVFSPSRFSLYTICVTEMLMRQKVNVKAIVVRKLFNRKRFLSEFSRDGSRLIEKIWRKLVLRQGAYKGKDYETIASFMQSENIRFKTVDDFKSAYGIPVAYCDDLNAAIVVETLQLAKPQVVVFTGGGLIRQEVLDHAGDGILNCHMGVLPKYRGMDVVEWPLLEDEPGQVGMTVHFMDKGLDTGDVLRVTPVALEPNDTIAQLRDRFEPPMCREIVDTCVGYLNGQITRVPQKLEDGQQYFLIHPRLMKIAAAKLSKVTTTLDS